MQEFKNYFDRAKTLRFQKRINDPKSRVYKQVHHDGIAELLNSRITKHFIKLDEILVLGSTNVDIVYMHINSKTGKYYVGKTNDLYGRWDPRHYNHGRIKDAIEYYGWNSFFTIILSYNIKGLGSVEDKEKKFIEMFDARNPEYGYNVLEGHESPEKEKLMKQLEKDTAEIDDIFSQEHVDTDHYEEIKAFLVDPNSKVFRQGNYYYVIVKDLLNLMDTLNMKMYNDFFGKWIRRGFMKTNSKNTSRFFVTIGEFTYPCYKFEIRD